MAYGVEIVLFYLLIYYVSKVLRDNDATRLMLLYWGLIVVMGAMKYAVELFDTQFYFYFVLILSMFMLVMFNVEVKKSLWDIHSPAKEKIEKLVNGTEARSQADVEHCISDIIKALQNMSKNNVGALIVLSKGNLPKQADPERRAAGRGDLHPADRGNIFPQGAPARRRDDHSRA